MRLFEEILFFTIAGNVDAAGVFVPPMGAYEPPSAAMRPQNPVPGLPVAFGARPPSPAIPASEGFVPPMGAFEPPAGAFQPPAGAMTPQTMRPSMPVAFGAPPPLPPGITLPPPGKSSTLNLTK